MRFIRLRYLRNEHNLLQKDIAKILHLNEEVYRRYENGDREIPTWALIELARYYNCTLEYITGRTNIRDSFGS